MFTQKLETLKDQGEVPISLISRCYKTFKYIYKDGKGNFIE